MLMPALDDADRLELKKQAKIDPEVRNALTPLVAGATDPDETRRQAVVGHLLQTCSPDFLALLARRLAEVFAHDRVPVRRQAAASLVQCGAPAVRTLTLAFLTTGRAVIQQHAVELLGEIGRGLSQEERGNLMIELNHLMGEAKTDAIRQQLMGTMMTLARECVMVKIARERAEPGGAEPGQFDGPVRDCVEG